MVDICSVLPCLPSNLPVIPLCCIISTIVWRVNTESFEPTKSQSHVQNIVASATDTGAFTRHEEIHIPVQQTKSPQTHHTIAESRIHNITFPSREIDSRCTAFLHSFANSGSAFIKCTIDHAKPLRFCTKCVKDYVVARSCYEQIMQDNLKSDDGRKCKDILLYSDRVMVVSQIYNSVQSIWDRSHCLECFARMPKDENGTVDFEISEKVQKFNIKLNETYKCMENYTAGDTVDELAGNITVNGTLCKSCRAVYRELNKYYDHLQEDNQNRVCMDIVDVMNYTRMLWSKKFKCTRQHEDTIPVILLTTFFSLLPIIFYVASKVYGTRKEKKLLKQKRMKSPTAGTSTSLSEDVET